MDADTTVLQSLVAESEKRFADLLAEKDRMIAKFEERKKSVANTLLMLKGDLTDPLMRGEAQDLMRDAALVVDAEARYEERMKAHAVMTSILDVLLGQQGERNTDG